MADRRARHGRVAAHGICDRGGAAQAPGAARYSLAVTHENAYEQAALLATQGHPLPGEDENTTYVDDAEHWCRVYKELLAFKAALIGEMNERAHALSQQHTYQVIITRAP